MISFQMLALLVNIGIVLAVAAEAFRRRGTAAAKALIAVCAFIAAWTAAYIAHSAFAEPAVRGAANGIALGLSVLTATGALWIVLMRTKKRRWLTTRNVLLFTLVPVAALTLFATAQGKGAQSTMSVAS